MKQIKTLLLIFAAFLCAACEKYVAEEGTQSESKVIDGNLVVKAECVVTRAGETEENQESLPLKDRFTRMTMVLYQDDVRVDYVNQENSDPGFGTMSVDLDPGTYQLVVLAHSGQRSPTTTNCHKISFSAPLTDVFSYYGDVVIGKEASKITVQLTRAVAKIQLNITDEIPEGVSFFNYIYKGASVSFDPATQLGVTSSTRRNVEIEKAEGVKTFELYTFVSSDNQAVDWDFAGYSESNEVIGSKKFSDIPVSLRKVTKIDSPVFDGVIEGPTDITFTFDDTWEGVVDYTF
ncbi:MAG: FimB/Mfa2 family fimbrial subunit [Prevotellaceae bacterium]|nr:FimB/Mfa2 family fimbrial subunit [Prevotellaceae bacterium]MDY5210413.1 FimB/Mfa2 family fimbrial subunit [Prevotella sp.]